MRIELKDKILLEVREVKAKSGDTFRLARIGCDETFTNLTLFISDSVDLEDINPKDRVDLDINLTQKGNQLRANVVSIYPKGDING